MSFLDRYIGGHVNIGAVTIYGRNAMHFAVNIKTRRWGYVCFRLPLRCFGRWWPLYFYASPNGTPWAATFMVGRDHDSRDHALAPVRRRAFGHNFDTDTNVEELGRINGWAGNL